MNRPIVPHAFPQCRRQRGFSLVEILVVIGILAVLITLSVIGFKVVGTASRAKVTDNQLENCKSLFNEFTLTTSASNLYPPLASPVAAGRWVKPTDLLKDRDATTCSIAAVSPGNDDLLLQETARVISRLRAVPKNRQSLENMPADRVQKHTFEAVGSLPAGEAVVLLDGDSRPIYFVPGGGLTNVNRGYRGSGDKADSANYDAPGGLIAAPDRRPFWVSPGPDGDLTTGDDNLYSFGK